MKWMTYMKRYCSDYYVALVHGSPIDPHSDVWCAHVVQCCILQWSCGAETIIIEMYRVYVTSDTRHTEEVSRVKSSLSKNREPRAVCRPTVTKECLHPAIISISKIDGNEKPQFSSGCRPRGYVRACLAAPITVATRHSARTCHCIGA